MSNIYEVLVERGIIAQCTNEEKVKEILDHSKVPFYIGFVLRQIACISGILYRLW